MSDAHEGTPFGSDGAVQTPYSSEGAADPLALFESEAALAQSANGAAHVRRAQVVDKSAVSAAVAPNDTASQAAGTASKATEVPLERIPIALDDVLNRLGRVEWLEAVAIVEALCAVLIGGGAKNARVPELSSILLTAQGTVLTRGGTSTGSPGPPLARTLHALTAGPAIPVPLRLFITKWVSLTDGHSLADFAKELAFYARPDGTALIRAVYERALATPSAQPKPRPVVSNVVQAAAPRPQSRRLRRSRWVAAAVIVVGAGLTSIWMWRAMSASSDQGAPFSVSTVISEISEGARVVRAAAAAASERFSSATRAAAGAAGSESEPRDQGTSSAPAPESTRRPRAAVSARTPTQNASTRSVAGQPAAQSSRAPRDVGLDPYTGQVSPAVPVRGLPGETVAEETGINDASDASHVYSSADPDVTPPELRYPKLPAPLFSGVQAEVNTIELIVSEAGTVERVRLISTPRRMADMMLLSGAKTWVFEPASRRGQSVRYRLLVSWDATP